VVIKDLLLWYLPLQGWTWRQLTEPVNQAITILVPWSLLLPVVLWSALRASDPEQASRVRWVLRWAGVVFLLVAISQEQRMRYYLPLCPPVALLVAWWYSGLPLGRRRALGAGVWATVAAGFVVWQAFAAPRHNAATDLRAIRAAVTQPARALYALDGHELVFSFYLDRPVIALADMTKFARLGGGAHDAYVIIPERALAATPAIADFRVLAGGLVNGRRVFLIGPAGDSRRPSAAPAPSDVFHAPPDGQAATTVRPRR